MGGGGGGGDGAGDGGRRGRGGMEGCVLHSQASSPGGSSTRPCHCPSQSTGGGHERRHWEKPWLLR